MSVSPLERSVLERKERDELAAIAEAMGVKANSRTSKANLIEGILREAGVQTADEKPKRGRAAKADSNGGDKGSTENKAADTKPAAEGRAAAETEAAEADAKDDAKDEES